MDFTLEIVYLTPTKYGRVLYNPSDLLTFLTISTYSLIDKKR